ncbi:hypothetical protein PR202_gb08786 [Eleusine coracana subsp. coracana]|uniref:Uncharacterized protein n=1 Tax=Eleusine coracana subsp. coracana TaxID=191504 RepID=A0AAV5EFA1_ELECO|nr:hypothetical protein PR202_gb08786 [Eleusine coracana subsp. coracana]
MPYCRRVCRPPQRTATEIAWRRIRLRRYFFVCRRLELRSEGDATRRSPPLLGTATWAPNPVGQVPHRAWPCLHWPLAPSAPRRRPKHRHRYACSRLRQRCVLAALTTCLEPDRALPASRHLGVPVSHPRLSTLGAAACAERALPSGSGPLPADPAP